MKDKELPLSKSVLSGLGGWVNRQKDKMHNTSSRADNPFQDETDRNINISSYAVKAALEAIYSSFGSVMN